MILFVAISIFTLFFIIFIATCIWCWKFTKNETLEILPLYKKPVEYYCINLEKRPEKFQKLQQIVGTDLLKRFPAIDGKLLDLNLLDERVFTKHYINHVKENEKHRGHLGCSFSHYNMLNHIVNQNKNSLYVIFEDDAVLEKHWKENTLNAIERLELIDPHWDIFVLGFQCSYNYMNDCHANDTSSFLLDKIVEINFFSGLWGYVINGKKAANKILKESFPANWMVDLEYGKLAKNKKIKVYGVIPNTVFHPGQFEISSFNYGYVKPYLSYHSDTNN